MRIYVGNLVYDVTDRDLDATFSPFGSVESAQVMSDRDTGRSKGFGFVEMPNKSEGGAAIAALSGQDMKGRNLTVNEARPRAERPAGGGNRW